MAGHIHVIKLIAKIAVVANAGENVEQQFGHADGDESADGERRKRRGWGSLRVGIYGTRTGGGRHQKELCSYGCGWGVPRRGNMRKVVSRRLSFHRPNKR